MSYFKRGRTHWRLGGLIIDDGRKLDRKARADRLVICQGSAVPGAGALGPFDFVPPMEFERAPRWRARGRREVGADTMTVYAPPSND